MSEIIDRGRDTDLYSKMKRKDGEEGEKRYELTPTRKLVLTRQTVVPKRTILYLRGVHIRSS